MANDNDMLRDIEDARQVHQDLEDCYNARYGECNLLLAEELKRMFKEKHKYWGNYY